MDRIVTFFVDRPLIFELLGSPNQSPMPPIVTHPNYDHENIKSYKTSMNYMCTLQHTTVDPLSKYIWNPRQLIPCQNPSDIRKIDSDLHL
jgi:hypothetical protein